jgi:hypothetical protein
MPMPSEQHRSDASRALAPGSAEIDDQVKIDGPKQIVLEMFHKQDKVRVNLNGKTVDIKELPDSHLKANAVFPRSSFPRSIISPPASPRGRVVGRWDGDYDDTSAMHAIEGMPVASTTMVRVPLMNGHAELPIPQMTLSRREKEFELNRQAQVYSWNKPQLLFGESISREGQSVHMLIPS